MKQFLILFFCILLLNGCGKEESDTTKIEEPQIVISLPNDLSIIYEYQKDSLPDSCSSKNDIICTIENVIKCALNPKLTTCDSQTMPEFLFYDDSIFAEDNVEGRPTKQSFKLLKYKPLDNHTIEVYTEGHCDHNWFGACEGNIIYVMNNTSKQWQVKEIYAVEKIK